MCCVIHQKDLINVLDFFMKYDFVLNICCILERVFTPYKFKLVKNIVAIPFLFPIDFKYGCVNKNWRGGGGEFN